MALSRSEIEVLIRARNEAKGAFDQLNTQIKGVTGETNKARDGMDGLGKKTKDTGAAATATGVAVGILAERLARGLVSGFRETIDAANRLDAGLIGLSSVAKAFGSDAEQAKEAAITLAKDGLLSVGEAATGLKNLLASGFSLDQATVLMNRFKDSAAFGRQGALEFGQAIVSATEGVKNGNSILVDNAGVTKNLSQILVEAGLSAQDLSKASTDVNVRMALFNGIVKETNPQLGDTAKFLDTAAGKQAQFNAQVEIAQQKIGKALQPALAAALDVAQPFVQVIGEAAPVLVPMAAGLSAVVIPLVAMKGAAALGITSIKDLTGQLRLTTTVAQETTLAMKGLNLAIKGLIIFEVITFMNGMIGKMEEWNLAALEAQGITGDTAKEISNFNLQAQAAGNPLAGLIIAVRAAKDEFLELKGGIQAARAELDLPEIASPFDNLRKSLELTPPAIDGVMARFDGLTGRTVDVQARIRDLDREISQVASVGGLQKLREALQSGVYDTGELAKAFGISEAAIERYEEKLKNGTKAAKEAGTEAAKLAQEQQKVRDSLEQLGLITGQQANIRLKELADLELAAVESGVDLNQAVKALWPQLDELTRAAIASGTATEELRDAWQRADGIIRQQIPALIQATDTWNQSVLDAGQQVSFTMNQADIDTMLAGKAMERLGITSRAELVSIARASEQAWQDIVRVHGEKSPEAVAAYKAMIDAEKKATGELPGFWQTQVFPGITGVVKNIATAVEGSFAQMLLGAKGFGEGFTDIWKSIKAGVLNILNEILSAFINNFLKGMLGAMAGSQGAFGSAFAGLLGGARGGVPGLGLLGGGASAAGGGIPGVGIGGLGGPGAGGGGFGAFATGGVGSSLIGGGVGLGVGFGIGDKYGTGAGIGSGIGSGALTGLALGGPIGAGVGAVAGLIGGIIGGQRNNTLGQRQAFSQQLGFGDQDALFAGLRKQAGGPEAEALIDQALNKIGKKDEAANTAWMEQVIALFDQAAMKLGALNAATAEYGLTWEDMDDTVQQTKINETAEDLLQKTKDLEEAGYRHDAVLTKQAGSYSELVNKAKALGEDVPDALRPVLQELIDMGLLVDENGEKIEDLSAISFGAAKDQATAFKNASDEIERVQKKITALAKAEAEAQTEDQRDELRLQREELERHLDDLQRQFDESFPDGVVIPVHFEVDDFPDIDPTQPGLGLPGRPGGYVDPYNPDPVGGEGGPEGAAAGGVMANRPGLVIFGEGGETEVGGPASFFERIFRKLGLGGGGGAGGPSIVVNFEPGAIQTWDAAGFDVLIDRKLIPGIVDAWSGNRRGARTNSRQALGVTG